MRFLLLTFLLAVTAHAQNVLLAWNAPADLSITGYNIHYGTASGVYTGIVDAGNNTSGVVQNIPAGSTYYFAVTSYNAAGMESGFSNEVSFKMPATPPATPTGLAAAAISNSEIDLSWKNTATWRPNFIIERSTDGINFNQIAVTYLLAYQDTAVQPATAYWYRIYAANGHMESGFTAVIKIVTSQ